MKGSRSANIDTCRPNYWHMSTVAGQGWGVQMLSKWAA